VRVYYGQSQHRAMHMGQQYSLANWRAVLMRGVDEFGYNRLDSSASVQVASSKF
jgi:hypothetical protein